MKTKPEQITLEDVREELKREIKMRTGVYPRWIEQGKIDAQIAAYRILVLKAHLLFIDAKLKENGAQKELFQ